LPDYTLPSLGAITLMEKGARVLVWTSVNNAVTTVYTVPAGKVAYLLTLFYSAYNISTTSRDRFIIYVKYDTNIWEIIDETVQPNGFIADIVTGGIVRLAQGEQIVLQAGTYIYLTVSLMIIEI
jgi:hypothetical protein